MKEVIRKISAGLGIASLLAFSVLGVVSGVSSTASAASDPEKAVCDGVNKVLSGGCSNSEVDAESVWSAAATVVNWILIAVGIIAVVFIIIGGVRYATSGGDPEKVKKAKNTLLYAIIGLAIALLASVIVNLVVSVANNLTTSK